MNKTRIKNQWYHIENIHKIDSPALVIYEDRVKANIKLLKEKIGDTTRLRPHVKTHKSIEVTRFMLAAGIQKFKCATVAEAEMLAIAGAEDVLLAYQPVGPKLTRFTALMKAYPKVNFSCLVDNERSAEEISDAALSSALKITVYIDLNVGMDRTGIAPGTKAVTLYETCSDLEGLVTRGLHVYDGHFKNPDFEIRKKSCDTAFSKVLATKKAIEDKGLPDPLIIAGGSPTFPIHAERKGVECSPGTFIYWDKGYQTILPEQNFLPAALVISRIISFPDTGKICLDLGHKSIAAENELSQRVFFLNAPDLTFISQSEEHLVASTSYSHSYKIGDVLYGLPYHICPTCALYEKAYIIKNHQVTDTWKIIARDRKIKF